MCCISGLVVAINFVQCSLSCSFCPWEANLGPRSARIVDLDLDMLLTAIERYKPELIFFSGGDFWYSKSVKDFLEPVLELEILKGAKLVIPPSTSYDFQQLSETANLFDVILLEVCEFTDVTAFLDVIEIVVRDKHTEVVIVWNTSDIANRANAIICELASRGIYVPINIVLHQYEEKLLHQFIDSARKNYPLVHAIYAPSSEYSSILCPKCRIPVVVRHGVQVLKISVDENCRCMYCGHKVISTGKAFCRSRKIVRIPINIPLV